MRKGIYIKKYIVITFGILLASTNLCACAGSIKAEPLPAAFSYGVISSYDQDAFSKLLCFDKELNILEERKLKISNVGKYNFNYPIIRNNHAYDISLGQGFNKDNCAIMDLDLETGEMKTYPFSDRVNITDFQITEEYIYAISNLNGQTYIDRYSFKEKSMLSYIVNMTGIDMGLSGEDLYLFVGDVDADDTETYKMYQIDIPKKKTEEVFDFTSYYKKYDGFGSSTAYQDAIYIPHGYEILKFTKKDKKVKEIPLDYLNAYGAYSRDSILYVACTEVYDEESESEIVVLDMDTDKIIQEYHFEHPIEQFWVDGDKLVILGHNYVLYSYSIQKDGTCKMEYKNDLGEQGYDFLSALIVKEEQ